MKFIYVIMLPFPSLSGGDPQIRERHGVIIPVINRLSSYFSDTSPVGETAAEHGTEKELEPLQAGE